jgi:hypothetical protein
MIRYFPDLEQGTDEWKAQRCGLLTASEMKLIVTPTLKLASNDKERAHLYELLAQRIGKYVEPSYISDDMLRGKEDEIDARALYEKHVAPVETMGFITNDRWGFTLGFSPDGLVGDDTFIETKSRRQKYQYETIIENVVNQTIPADYLIQQQTGHLVSERPRCDFISYSGGNLAAIIRVYADAKVQNAIIEAAGAFEQRMAKKMAEYWDIVASGKYRLFPTERKIEQEMYVS